MTENKQDALIRAYAILSALRKNIGEIPNHNVAEKYVQEFHIVLDKVDGIGIDVAEFRIPDSEVQPRVIGAIPVSNVTGTGTGEVRYSIEKYVDRSFILTKLDAILGYLEILTAEKPREMGYHKPDK